MPKPPTAQRGRPARQPVAVPPPPGRTHLLRRLVAGHASHSGAVAGRASGAPAGRAWRRTAVAEAPETRTGVRSARREAMRSVADEPAPAAWSAGASAEGGAADGASAEGGASFGPSLLGTSWRGLASLVLCLFGLAVSVYLTIAHYANYAVLCARSSVFNCEAVTHSPQSVVFGIPVAVLGLAYFVPMLALCSPWAWRSANRFVAPLRLAGVVTGVGFVFYLVYNELFVIGKICLWCSSVHLVTLLLFVLVATGWDEAAGPARLAAWSDGGESTAFR
jgi:uncharacterized membrane protein